MTRLSSAFCAGALLVGAVLVQGFVRPHRTLPPTRALRADLSDLVTALGGITTNQRSQEAGHFKTTDIAVEPPLDYAQHSECTFTPPPPLITTLPPLTNDPIFFFGDGVARVNKGKSLLGGKGAGLLDMSSLGLAVPPGFTVTTEVCDRFVCGGGYLPEGVWQAVLDNIRQLERVTGKTFGGGSGPDAKPLLVSVRSGAAVSMPGMMDTLLSVGLNDANVDLFAKAMKNERAAYDSFRRLLQMYGGTVLGIPHEEFDQAMNKLKKSAGVETDSQLDAGNMKQLVKEYKAVYNKHGKVFPSDPYEQLYQCISTVFNSWTSSRAVKYREAEGITGLLGTAVTVQAMVFGNLGSTSGTGVCFSRNPNTGDEALYGEYLEDAQGEDVVAGIRTPLDIQQGMRVSHPQAYQQLVKNVRILESAFHDMQDIEFTVENGKLYLLQTRSGKRTGSAAVKIAVNLVLDGLATIDQAILTVKPEHLKQLLHPQFEDVNHEGYTKNVLAKGLAASPGAAVGRIMLTPEAAEACHARGDKAILVREDTSPEDVAGMWAATGVLTSTGGFTSHASVVARGWGKPCVCGCSALNINMDASTITLRDESGKVVTLKEGDWISINGETGEVLLGPQPLAPPSVKDNRELTILMAWVDARRKLKVLANADTPKDAAEARRNGAQGIGLLRTEHMFFEDDRISVVRRMILGKGDRRTQALKELLEFQRNDFAGILEAMDGLPVTVRLLDPPLHEFLPRINPDEKVALSATDSVVDDAFAASMGMTREEVLREISRMGEVNPMLGLRGCRLGITIPELTAMQVQALLEAAIINKAKGLSPKVEIMVPLIGSANEFKSQKAIIEATAEKVFADKGERVSYTVGTMIEVPRAALTAEEIAMSGCSFFSYGTNDLTQMTLGFSRDDVGSFLPTYIKQGILETDPFEVIDQAGVGKLVEDSANKGKEIASKVGTRNFKVGVCGEHGGDPTSVKFFHRIGMGYVSCSPFRVPLARLAAAHANIEEDALKGCNV